VLEASDGQEAINVPLESDIRNIRLFLTDIVRPNVGCNEWPGYSEENVLEHRTPDLDVEFMQKPFQPGAFTRAVRGMLESYWPIITG